MTSTTLPLSSPPLTQDAGRLTAISGEGGAPVYVERTGVADASAASDSFTRASGTGLSQASASFRAESFPSAARAALGLLVLLLLWQIGAWLLQQTMPIASLLAPWPTFKSLGWLLGSGQLWAHVLASLQRVLVGLVLALVIGVPLGLLIGRSRAVEQATGGAFQLLRMISPLSWMPIVVMLFGVGDAPIYFLLTFAAVWPWVRFPLAIVLTLLLITLLYAGTSNVRRAKFALSTIGAAVALVAWIVLTGGLYLYAVVFGGFDSTYGAFAGVLIFLFWLWLTNTVLLFGAEIDAEVERSRQLQAGIKAEESLQLPPRDTRQSEKSAEKLVERIEEGRQLRLQARAAGARGHRAPAAGTDDKPADDRPVAERDHKAGENADPADRSAHDVVLEPLPSEEAQRKGY